MRLWLAPWNPQQDLIGRAAERGESALKSLREAATALAAQEKNAGWGARGEKGAGLLRCGPGDEQEQRKMQDDGRAIRASSDSAARRGTGSD